MATFFIILMALGFIVRERAIMMFACTGRGTLARFEAQRAIEAGGLLMILTAPWLVISAVALY